MPAFGPCNNPSMVTTTQEPIRQANPRALGFAIPGAIGLLVAFVATVVGFAALEAGGAGTKLIGADNELGLPSSAFGMVFFVIVLSIAMAEFGGATIAPGLWRALVPVLIITVLFQAWALYLGTQGGSPYWPLVLVQLACAIGALVIALLRAPRGVPNTVIGTTLVVGSVVAFFAAFRLSVDKVGTYIDPATAPSCNYSVIVQCGVNLRSWQGSLFGFPNPVLGVGGWIAVLVIGILILSGARQARWFSIALNVGMLGALTLVGWLIYQSIFRLGTLGHDDPAVLAGDLPQPQRGRVHVIRAGETGVQADLRVHAARHAAELSPGACAGTGGPRPSQLPVSTISTNVLTSAPPIS